MTATSIQELTRDSVVDYLVHRGIVKKGEVSRVEEFSGGVSSVVLRVRTKDRDLVVKQPLEKLRTAQEWLYDRRRMLVERNALIVMPAVLPVGSVPNLVASDEENYVVIMTCAPDGGEVWKVQLMRGEVSHETARQAGSLLQRLHKGATQYPDLHGLFPSNDNFVEGRIKPYFEMAAAANPDVQGELASEVDRLLSKKVTLVHGDFSPKNIIAYVDHVLLLDHEVAHVGDPSFDVGFCLTHLCMKALHFAPKASLYLESAESFWESYAQGVSIKEEFTGECVCQLGAIMLARIDGKSRLEYVQDEQFRAVARRLAKTLLCAGKMSMGEAIGCVRTVAQERSNELGRV